MYGEFLGGHILLVYCWIELLFILIILAFEGYQDYIRVIYSYKMYTMKVTQRNKGSGEH